MKKRALAENRAYSILEIKSVQSDERRISGIATTPETDRMGDIVEPMGAQFKNPLPLLWQHRHDSPVGQATFGKPTKEGIPFEAELPIIEEPGPLKDMVDLAWQTVKAGLVRGVSIGFRAIEYAYMDSGGIRFVESEIYELSLVTIPANASATIQTIRSMDSAVRAALGTKDSGSTQIPGVSGRNPVVKIHEDTDMSTNTIGDQIADFEATREKKAKAMMDIINKSVASGETLDAEQTEAYETLESEIEAIDKHLEILRKTEKMQMASAQPVKEEKSQRIASPAGIRVEAEKKQEAGIGFARYARCKLLAAVDREPIESVVKHLYPGDDRLMASITKAAVSAAGTGDSAWAGNLVLEGGAFADFVEYLRPRTLLGQIEPSLRRLPFDTPVLVQTAGGTGYWVKEGNMKPMTSWGYSREKLEPLVVASITAATKQQLMRASIDADRLFRDELVRSIGYTIDATFIDPNVAPVSDESPGSILNGVDPISLGGDSTIAGIRADIAQFQKTLVSENLSLSGAFWIMSEVVAIDLSMATNEVGGPAFPGISATGGMLAGRPVYTSQHVPHGVVALVVGDEIFFGDEGGIDVAMSDSASLVMADTGSMNSTTPTPSQMVSMFQTNSIAFRVERFLNWKRRRSEAVVWANVTWSSFPVETS